MKRFLIFLSIFLAIFFSFVAAKNIIVKQLLEASIERELGVNINIRDLDVSFLGGNLTVKGLSIDNPAGFEKQEFAYVPLINIVCNPLACLRRKGIVIYFLNLDIERMNIIKGENGETNLKKFSILERKESQGAAPFTIEIFKLSFQDIYYIECLPNHKTKSRRYNLDIKDLAFGKLNSFEDIFKLVVLKAMAQTDIGKLINLSVVPLLADTRDIIFVSGKAAKDIIKNVFNLPSLIKGNN